MEILVQPNGIDVRICDENGGCGKACDYLWICWPLDNKE